MRCPSAKAAWCAASCLQTHEVTPDKQGRILIPQELMQQAHLSKAATVFGISNYCEIWDDRTYQQQMDEQSSELLARTVEELGL